MQDLCDILTAFGHLKRLKGDNVFLDGSEWYRFARDEGYAASIGEEERTIKDVALALKHWDDSDPIVRKGWFCSKILDVLAHKEPRHGADFAAAMRRVL